VLLAQGPAVILKLHYLFAVASGCWYVQTVVLIARPCLLFPLHNWLRCPCFCRDDRRRNNPRPYNTAYRVVVSGLPPTASWQDLKDHMRKGGEVTFAQVGTARVVLLRTHMPSLSTAYATPQDFLTHGRWQR